MSAPSMVHKSGNTLVVRSVVSGDRLFDQSDFDENQQSYYFESGGEENELPEDDTMMISKNNNLDSDMLPQCKVRRNYACTTCNYFTQNPRFYLHHLKNIHHEKFKVYECPHCLYASKHSQKLQRHIHMVHVMGKRKSMIKANRGIKRSSGSTATVVAISPPHSLSASPEENSFNSLDYDETDFDSPPMELIPTVILNENTSELPPIKIDDEENNYCGSMVSSGPQQEADFFKCSVCDFTSHNQSLVTRHEKIIHLKKKIFRCTKCNYVTHMKARFTKHVKYHSMPMIKCDMCDFQTPYKWNLDRHNKNHYNNGAFKCLKCNFRADIKQSLTVHETNHHVPALNHNGQPVVNVGKRRCRVGASDTIFQQQSPPPPLLDMLRPTTTTTAEQDFELTQIEPDDEQNFSTLECSYKMAGIEISKINGPTTIAATTTTSVLNQIPLVNGKLSSKDVIMTKNGSVYVKKYKCRVCHYKAAWESEMVRHERRVHGLEVVSTKKKIWSSAVNSFAPKSSVIPGSSLATLTPIPNTTRPVPNLIPILNKLPTSISISKIPKQSEENNNHHSFSQRDLNDIYTKSCPNSSLKDFASLICKDEDFDNSAAASSLKILEPIVKRQKNDNNNFKKKNATFFDKLKEKLIVGAGETYDLGCNQCGHKSKCLSESVIHQKAHARVGGFERSLQNDQVAADNELSSSTRCQYCRQRCKTSSDLILHMQSCLELSKLNNTTSSPGEVDEEEFSVSHMETDRDEMGRYYDGEENEETMEQDSKEYRQETEEGDVKEYEKGDLEEEDVQEYGNETAVEEDLEENEENIHAETSVIDVQNMEKDMKGEATTVEKDDRKAEHSKVFVWNECMEFDADKSNVQEEDRNGSHPSEEANDTSLKTTQNSISDEHEQEEEQKMEIAENEEADDPSLKRVFKCPHCSFWSVTASRFHVHIVGHLNKKPFECSLCQYRSNWRWDITKHIRLKKVKDSDHAHAKVLMTDETGRRNYTKYNAFLTRINIDEMEADSSFSTTMKKTKNSTSIPSYSNETGGRIKRSKLSHATFESSENSPLSPHTKISERPVANKKSQSKKTSSENKKTVWKCKKCTFRADRRETVLLHVKGHYNNSTSARSSNGIPDTSSIKDKQVAGVQIKNVSSGQSDQNDGNGGCQKCDICGYTFNSLKAYQIHMSLHSEKPNSSYRCPYCDFYSNQQEDIMNHVSVHDPALKENNDDAVQSGSKNDGPDQSNMFTPQTNNPNNTSTITSDEIITTSSGSKKYACNGCPYRTNNKSQYLYHKQFHKNRESPFQCTVCSYNVSKRHLLNQHLKVHGLKRLPTSPSPSNNNYSIMDDPPPLPPPPLDPNENNISLAEDITKVDTSKMSDIPLVWHYNDDDGFCKLYKCRTCTAVHNRKSKIQQHEKLHFSNINSVVAKNGNKLISPPEMSCTECDYKCTDGSLLILHYRSVPHMSPGGGKIYDLVEPNISNELQLKNLCKILENEKTFFRVPDHQQQQQNSIGGSNIVDFDQEILLQKKILHFCTICPARFNFLKELEIHCRFHMIDLSFKCNFCSYTARQQAQLSAHNKVHTNEYQERTDVLCTILEISKDYPRPECEILAESGEGGAASVWIIASSQHQQQQTNDENGPTKKLMKKKYFCDKCPAQFFKIASFNYHSSLHGINDIYKCRSCDYSVKMYNNLIKHESIHKLLPPRIRIKVKKNKSSDFDGNNRIIMTDDEQSMQLKDNDKNDVGVDIEQIDNNKKSRNRVIIDEQSIMENDKNNTKKSILTPRASPKKKTDPEFGVQMHGDEKFNYQPSLKNGVLKSRRYKCHKCPSAFEKRDQYKIHLSLHGSQQRYCCEKCDYSVKYYANYTQHMRKHDFDEQSKLTIDSSEKISPPVPPLVAISKIATPKASKSVRQSLPPPEMTTTDKQNLILMQFNKTSITPLINNNDSQHRCPYCPYSHPRKDAVKNHTSCHFNTEGPFFCEYCNYSVKSNYSLKEHKKLHFNPIKGRQPPEAYMKCDRLELYATDFGIDSKKTLLFKDNGINNNSNRFLPTIDCKNDDDRVKKKIYVNINTGEKEETDLEIKTEKEESLEGCVEQPKIKSETLEETDDGSFNGVGDVKFEETLGQLVPDLSTDGSIDSNGNSTNELDLEQKLTTDQTDDRFSSGSFSISSSSASSCDSSSTCTSSSTCSSSTSTTSSTSAVADIKD